GCRAVNSGGGWSASGRARSARRPRKASGCADASPGSLTRRRSYIAACRDRTRPSAQHACSRPFPLLPQPAFDSPGEVRRGGLALDQIFEGAKLQAPIDQLALAVVGEDDHGHVLRAVRPAMTLEA